MAYDQRSLDDYVDVAQRIADFRERYPEGTLQPADPSKPWELAIVSGTKKDGETTTQTFIVYTAAAYRTPADARPGIGVAWEIWPGRTPYTLGSELMNAETSAWGRAIIAVGASDSKRGVASRDELLARDEEQRWASWVGPEPASGDCLNGKHCGPCTGCRCHCHNGIPVNKDGSMALSKMSDEQRAAVGAMTRAQAKEHAALRAGKKDQPPADRATATPSDDPFYDTSGTPLPERDYDSPGTITRAQSNAMHAEFGRLGITDRDERLRLTAAALDAQLTSSSAMSRNQGEVLLAYLRSIAGKGDLVALLATGELPAGPQPGDSEAADG